MSATATEIAQTPRTKETMTRLEWLQQADANYYIVPAGPHTVDGLELVLKLPTDRRIMAVVYVQEKGLDRKKILAFEYNSETYRAGLTIQDARQTLLQWGFEDLVIGDWSEVELLYDRHSSMGDFDGNNGYFGDN